MNSPAVNRVSESSGGTLSDEDKKPNSLKTIIKWLGKFLEQNLEFSCTEDDFIMFVD